MTIQKTTSLENRNEYITSLEINDKKLGKKKRLTMHPSFLYIPNEPRIENQLCGRKL